MGWYPGRRGLLVSGLGAALELCSSAAPPSGTVFNYSLFRGLGATVLEEDA